MRKLRVAHDLAQETRPDDFTAMDGHGGYSAVRMSYSMMAAFDANNGESLLFKELD
jgi:hypothetical protein